ncbi:ribonuclease [Staphylococcus phage SpP]
MDKVIIATDGGVRGNQSEKNFGAYAAILHYKGHKRYISMSFSNTTNNIMELKGVIEGLKAMKRYDLPVEILSDSAYVVNAINKNWLNSWAKNGWIKSDGKQVKNMELWIELLELIKCFDDLTVTKVKGHSGHLLNEEVDQLVNDEMDKYLKANYEYYMEDE